MNVLLADDHAIVLDGLELLLSTFDFVDVVGKATDEEGVYRILEAAVPDVMLLDIAFGKSDGRTLCHELKRRYPGMKIIALTSYSNTSTVRSALHAGFDGYLLKSEDREVIKEALNLVAQGETYISAFVKDVIFEQSVFKSKISLTRREHEVLKLITDEKSTREIADALFISEKTVENHRASLMQKLEAKNMAGLVKRAILEGLTDI